MVTTDLARELGKIRPNISLAWSKITQGRLLYYTYSLIIYAFVLIKSNVIKGTTFYTPDSEFYLSLSSFGSQVTDRAPTPAYYFTRFGVIEPIYILNKLIGVQNGLFLYRFILFTFLFISVLILIENLNYKNEITKTILMTFILTNSVILSFLGDPYVSGTAITCTFVNAALAQIYIKKKSELKNTYIFSFLLGINLAWALFINQQFCTFIGINNVLLFFLLERKGFLSKKTLSNLALLICGALIQSIIFLKIGKLIFPELDWLDTTTFYARILKASSYSSRNFEWIPVTYHVVGLSLFAVFIFVNLKRFKSSNLFHEINFILIFLTFAVQSFFSHAVLLEANFYNALLWPYFVAALVAFISKSFNSSTLGIYSSLSVLGLVLVLLVLFAKSNPKTGQTFTIFFIVAAISLMFMSVARYSKKQGVVWLAVFVVSIQAIQSTVIPGSSVVNRIPFNASFSSKNTHKETLLKLQIEKWLISNTNSKDRVFVWAAPNSNLVQFAAMQLWGPNSIETPKSKLDWNYQNLNAIKPDKLILYSNSEDEIDIFLKKLDELDFSYRIEICSLWDGEDSNIYVCVTEKAKNL